MKIICLMGRSGANKSDVEIALEKFGYTRVISYTTRKIKDNEINGVHYHFVSKDDFVSLVKKGIIIEYTEYDGDYYGSPRPIGSSKNVVVVEPDGYKAIHNIYGDKQVVGVYIDTESHSETSDEIRLKNIDDEKFKDISDIVDLVVDGKAGTNTTVAKILAYIKTRTDLY